MKIVQYLIILCFAALAANLSFTLPFYFSWDMELVFIQDLLMMQNNQLPIHMAHPGMGMAWLYLWFQDIASFTGLISDVNITNLGNSFEPLVLIAEQMEFIRSINAISCIVLSLTLWKVVTTATKLNKLQNTLTLVVFLTLPGIWRFNVLLVRTETFSLIFWAIAVLYTVKAGKENIKFNTYIAGFFAALSFFTKIQSFVLITLLPIIYLVICNNQENEKLPIAKPFKFKTYLFAFLALCVLSAIYHVPNYIVTFTEAYNPNKFFVVFILLILIIKFYTSGKYNSLLKIEFPHKTFSYFLIRFLQGAVLVLILPFFMLMNPLKSAEYSLAIFKMIFVRWIVAAALSQDSLLHTARVIMQNNWGYFLLLFIIAGFILVFRKQVKEQYRVYSGAILVLLLGVHSVLAVRPKTQDGIWVEVALIIILLILCVSFEKTKKILTPVLILVGFFNIYILTEFKSMSVSKGIAYYDSHMFFDDVYNSPAAYNEIMAKVYKTKEQKDRAIVFASRWKEWKNILTNNFSESNLTLRDISQIGENLVIHLNKIGTKELKIHYRPDMTQIIFLPEKEVQSLTASGCELIKSNQPISYNGQNSLGYAVRLIESKGRYPGVCTVRSDFLKNGIVVVSMSAMATFRNLDL